MNGKDVLFGMSYIDEQLVQDLLLAREEPKDSTGNRRRAPLLQAGKLRRFSLLAACTLLIFVGTYWLGNQHGISEEPLFSTISIDDIAVNALAAYSSGKRVYHFPEDCRAETWTEREIKQYFGRSLVPSYLPEGLQASPNNDKKTVYLRGDTVYFAALSVDFYHAFDENDTPIFTEGVAAEKGFTLTAWKQELTRDYSWGTEEDTLKTTEIGGTEVIFGYRAMDYGPYDEKTHAPAGSYDLYVATFTLGDVHYEVVSHQLPLEEVVKIVEAFIG